VLVLFFLAKGKNIEKLHIKVLFWSIGQTPKVANKTQRFHFFILQPLKVSLRADMHVAPHQPVVVG
jgi:hypothetical protein